jgi:iron(III) transport system substrate-binding protein
MRLKSDAKTLFFLACLFFASSAVGAAAPAKNAEEVWKALEKLPAEERHKRLVQGAKAEGELVWYTNTGLENAANYIKAFKQVYPFINAKFWRGKSRDVTQRLITEARAGHFYADVFKTTADLLPDAIDRNLIGRYESPIRASYPPHAKGLLWSNMNYAFRVFGFNPKKLKSEAVPKTWDELLHPRWKEEILFDESSLEEVITLLAVWGKNKTVDYLRKFGEQKPLVRRGRDTIAQLLMAGEGLLAVTIYAYNAESLRAVGAPIDWVAPDLIPTLIYPLTMVRQAPHPHAAALFYDFLLSDAGQQMIAKEGRVVANRNIEPIYPRMKELRALLGTPRVHINTIEEAPKYSQEGIKIFDEFLAKRKV